MPPQISSNPRCGVGRCDPGAWCAISTSPPATIQFSNVTRRAGIEFVHYKGNQGMSTILEEAGPGVAVADYDGDGTFTDVSAQSGGGFTVPYAGRGVAFADVDNDGRMEMVVANNGSEPLLHNDGPCSDQFVNFKLVGTRSNRDAGGARVKLRSGTLSQIREVMGGGSYLSGSDLRLQFSLGPNTHAEEVNVTWPSALRQTFRGIEADRFYLIEEANPTLGVQRFRPRHDSA